MKRELEHRADAAMSEVGRLRARFLLDGEIRLWNVLFCG